MGETAWIYIGGPCNNHCAHCVANRHSVPQTHDLALLLERARQSGVDSVHLTGGEPTMRRDLGRILAVAGALGLKITIHTNARAVANVEYAKTLANLAKCSLVVSVFGPTAASHDQHVGAVAFDQTMAGIANAVAEGLSVQVDVVVTNQNLDLLADTMRLFAAKGVQAVNFRLIEGGDNPSLVPDLTASANAVSTAVVLGDLEFGGRVNLTYEAFGCCLLPDLQGRESPNPRQSLSLYWSDEGPVESAPGPAFRALPMPCAACGLRSACSTVEPAVVAERGAVDLFDPTQTCRGIVFRPIGEMDDFALPKCPFRAAPSRTRPGVDRLIFDRGDGTYALYAVSEGYGTPSAILHTKNMRSAIAGPSGTRWEVHPTCAECDMLAVCAGCYKETGEPMPVQPVAMTVDGQTSSDPLRWTDFPRDWAAFLEHAGTADVHFTGSVPYVRVSDSKDGDRHLLPMDKGTVEHLLVWDAVRTAARTAIKDYELPYGGPVFDLTLSASDRWAEDDKLGTLLILKTCTMNCIICQVQKFFGNLEMMPLPNILKFLEEFKLLGYTRLDLFGGEPTMRRDLVELIRFAHRMGFFTDLITNGTLMDDALATGLRDAGLDLCMVSLDGPTAEVHDKIRRVKDGHVRAVKGIEAIVRAGELEVNIDTVILPENYGTLLDLARQARDFGVTRINMFLCLEGPISSPVPRLLGYENTLYLYESIIPEMQRIVEPAGIIVTIAPRIPMGGKAMAEVGRTQMFKDVADGTYNVIYHHPEIRCKAPDDEVYVSLSGDVYPCTAPQILESDAKMGNAYQDKLIHVLASPTWQEFREIAGHHHGCRMCWRAHFDLTPDVEAELLARE